MPSGTAIMNEDRILFLILCNLRNLRINSGNEADFLEETTGSVQE